jgi:recombination protein RecT
MNNQTENKTLSKPSKKELREVLGGEEFRRKLGELLPKTMSPERFVRIAFQALHNNPDLARATQESFLNCLFKLGALGLEPDGRRAHLIPFKLKDGSVECTLIVDYKGLKELVRRHRDVSAMHGDVVGQNDEFEVRYGTHGVLDHKPNLIDRGPIICAYSWIKLPDGNEEYDVMSTPEIEAVRRRSKSADKGPWVTDWNEMAKKTVFRRHAKGLPLSPQTRDAIESGDGEALTDQERFNAAAPAKASVLGAGARQRSRLPVEEQAQYEPPMEQESAAVAAAPAKSPRAAAPPAPTPLTSVEMIRTNLAISGFTEADLLALMKPLRLAPANATKLEQCEEAQLFQVVEEWDAALLRLGQNREAQAEAVP